MGGTRTRRTKGEYRRSHSVEAVWVDSPEEPKRVVRKREGVKVTETIMSAPENGSMTMEGMMRMMMELEASRDTLREKAERDRREEERGKRDQTRELRWQERDERMMTRWQSQMDAASTRARPGSEMAKIPVATLPRLCEGKSLTSFLAVFEAQMKGSKVPKDQWKLHLVGQMSKSHQDRVFKCIADDDATYGDIVRKLGNVEDVTQFLNFC